MTAHEWTATMRGFFIDLYNNPARLSFTEIARAMNAEFGTTLTRNACIGKSHRLFLPIRGPHERQRKADNTKTGGRKMRRKPVRIDAPIAPVLAPRCDDDSLDIYQLRDGDCHWPLGAMTDYPPFQYCGKQTEIGRSYCPDHCERAYNKPGKAWA
jgi:GcrA cell cycle regulator